MLHLIELVTITYDSVKKTVGKTGLILLHKLEDWKVSRGDIEFEDTEIGFNINLKTAKGSVTVLVFWGQRGQPTSQLMESRQNTYPAFANIESEDKIQINHELRNAYFQNTSGKEMNVKLEFAQLPADSVGPIINAIDGAVNIIKAKCET